MSADENTDGIGDQAENEDGPSAVDTNDVNDGNTGDETENEDATSTVDTDDADDENTGDEAENEDGADDHKIETSDAQKSKKKKIIFAGVGAGVLIISVAAGASFWLIGGETTTKVSLSDNGRVQMAMPSKAPPAAKKTSSLNTTFSDESESSSGSLNAAASDESESSSGSLNAPGSDEGGGSLNAVAGLPSGNSEGLVIPSVTASSFRRARKIKKAAPLVTAPSRAMLETVEGLKKPLPMIDKDGRKPWEVYARPLTGSEKGQPVAIMVVGLGLSRAATMAAIRKLPPEVSLIFDPYANNLQDWLVRARQAGHEVFVSLPMESNQFPSKDPGPLALTTTVQSTENLRRLHAVLSSFGGYVGVVSTMGSKFSTADAQLKPVLEEVKKRGLMFVDATSTSTSSAPTIAAEIGLPAVKNNMVLDTPPSSENIQNRLKQLERLASKNTTALAIIRPYPVSIFELQTWTKTIAEKKLALVPVSSLVKKND